jgi:PKD repeat protein
MVVDPLVFSTYLGSAQWDSAGAVEVDDEGYLYISGDTDGSDFPTTAGSYQENHNNFRDIFVMKMAADGATLVWSTFIGGTDSDTSSDLALDAFGNVYVCGSSFSDNYPTTPGAFQTKTSGHGDAVVSKLNPSGSRLLASTLVGGFWEDPAYSIAVDDSGNMYITGYTQSVDFPTTNGSHDVEADQFDAFVTKINSTATDLVYSTYLGGSGQDMGDSIVLDDNGSVYVVGNTWSTDFPVSNDAFRIKSAGSADGFVTKVEPNGTFLEASSYLGGQFFDEAMGVALGSDGDVHVFGSTLSDDFPVTTGAFQTTHGSARVDYDAFATRMNWNLSMMRMSTFIGGDVEDLCVDGALDREDNVIIGGTTTSTTYPTTPGAYQTMKGAFSDAIITKLSANYTQLQYSTHIGSVDTDEGVAVTALGTLNAIIIGETFSDKFPVTPGSLQTKTAGNRDAFVSMFSLDLVPPVASAGSDVVIDQHEAVDFNGSASWDNIQVVNWTWSFTYDGVDTELYGPRPSWVFHLAGHYQVTLTVVDGARLEDIDTVNVTVIDITPPLAEAGVSRTVLQGETLMFNGTGSTDNVGIVNWTWTFDYFGEAIVLTGPMPEFTFVRAGMFNVSLTVWDGVGLNSTDHMMVDVQDLTAPVADAGPDVHVDQYEPAVLNGSLSSDTTAVVNWTWSFVHGGSPTEVYGRIATFIFQHAGTYEVLLRVSDAAGNSAVDTMTVHVRDVALPVAVAGPDQTVDEGFTVHFDGSGSHDNEGIVSYQWRFEYDGETEVLEGVDPTHTFLVPGTYLVTLTVTDAEDNVADGTLTVTVRDITEPVAKAGDDMTVDQGTTVTLDGTASSDNVAIVMWTWSIEIEGGIIILEGASPSYTFNEVAVVIITLTVVDGAGLTADDQMVVTVRDVTPPVAIARFDGMVDQGTTVTLDGSMSHDNVDIVSYLWTFQENGVTVTQEGASVDYPFNLIGTFAITLTVTDAEGNSDTDVQTLRVLDVTAPVISANVPLKASVGEEVVFDAASSSDDVGIVKWTWTFEEGDDTVVLDGARVRYAFKETGGHKVTLTLEDAEGNQATQDYNVQVSSFWWIYLIFVVALGIGLALALFRGRLPGDPGMRG